MITLEDNMCTSDIEQWIGGGWFLLKMGNGALAPAEVSWWPGRDDDEEYDEDENSLFVCRTTDGHEMRLDRGDLKECVFPHWPMCGSINLYRYKFAAHVERLQMKQWRRTFNWRQCKITAPQQWERTGHSLQSPETTKEVFQPKYVEPAELAEMFAEGWSSVALTPHVIVCNNATYAPLVYYNGELACKLRASGTFDPIDVRMTALLTKLYPGGIKI